MARSEAFLTRCTAAGYAVFASYLLGESDGIAKNAEWAAEDFGRVARRKSASWRLFFHQNTTMLMAGWGNAAPTVW
ncbi:hypothetical protein ACLB1T_10350 [Escherichia coli]